MDELIADGSMSGPLKRFLDGGVRACYRAGGAALVIASALGGAGELRADLGVRARSAGVVLPPEVSGEVRELARLLRAQPGEAFKKLADGLSPRRPDAYKTRETAMTLGDLLRMESEAGGDRTRDELADLLARGAREAVGKGLSLAATVDVMTMLDPFGTSIPDDLRRSLWLDLSRMTPARQSGG